MDGDRVEIRPAEERDRSPLAQLFAAVAEERDGIAAEPPIDVDRRARPGGSTACSSRSRSTRSSGRCTSSRAPSGFGEIGMMVARDWRGRGIGSALVAAAIDWSREQGLHKLTLSVFPHEAAIGLYRKSGFVEEGRREKQMRRANGELWDLVEMGLQL